MISRFKIIAFSLLSLNALAFAPALTFADDSLALDGPSLLEELLAGPIGTRPTLHCLCVCEAATERSRLLQETLLPFPVTSHKECTGEGSVNGGNCFINRDNQVYYGNLRCRTIYLQVQTPVISEE